MSLLLLHAMDLVFFHELRGVWLLGARSRLAFYPLFFCNAHPGSN